MNNDYIFIQHVQGNNIYMMKLLLCLLSHTECAFFLKERWKLCLMMTIYLHIVTINFMIKILVHQLSHTEFNFEKTWEQCVIRIFNIVYIFIYSNGLTDIHTDRQTDRQTDRYVYNNFIIKLLGHQLSHTEYEFHQSKSENYDEYWLYMYMVTMVMVTISLLKL